MKLHSLAAFCAATTFAALCATGAHAQVSISPASVTATIMEGSTLTFTANVTNTSGANITLGGDNANFLTQPMASQTEFGPPTSPFTLALDDTPYLSMLPVTLAAGATQTFTLYNLTAGLAAVPGTYTGYFVLQDDSQNDLAGGTQNFSFTVSPLASAPEPAGWVALLVGAGTLGIVGVRRRAALQSA